ncbi:MAG: hypothetical protein JOS17DRAFT_746427 [Linnemannia elongata]|nr:MAG: hypothetical protein JOS17DRAFT_746427 [Linnemannia elongata]
MKKKKEHPGVNRYGCGKCAIWMTQVQKGRSFRCRRKTRLAWTGTCFTQKEGTVSQSSVSSQFFFLYFITWRLSCHLFLLVNLFIIPSPLSLSFFHHAHIRITHLTLFLDHNFLCSSPLSTSLPLSLSPLLLRPLYLQPTALQPTPINKSLGITQHNGYIRQVFWVH